MREHTRENARIHCVLPDGGEAPNVVPDSAELWYYVRGRDRAQVDDLRRRLRLCARGAAMATETRMRMQVETCITERIRNSVMAGLLGDLFGRLGPAKLAPADLAAARKLFPKAEYNAEIRDPQADAGRASSDEDNVSWFAPLGGISTACVPEGTTGHHRDYAAAVRLPAAHKAMMKAAEVLAAAAVELALNAPLLKKAQAEFKENRKGKTYDLPLSPNVQPPVYGKPKT
jgi:aminobenzoyl-glutamate utilization protein B